MKKLFVTFFTAVISQFAFTAFAADMLIQPNQLPQNSQQFISKTFKNANIVAAKRDKNSFEAILNTGAKIEFNLSGEWEEIEAYSALPDGLLPAAVEKAAKSQGGQNIKIDKDFGYYEVKLNNNLELKIDMNGNILKRKMD